MLNVVWKSCPHGLIEIDRQGVVVSLNPAMERILGLVAARATGRPLQEVIAHRELVAALTEVLRTGRRISDSSITNAHHEYVFNCVPVIQCGSVAGAVGELRDITRLKRARQETAAARNKIALLEAALEGIYNGVIVVDGDARVVMFNRAYCDFLGLAPEDVLGRPVWEVIENTRMHVVLETGRAEIGEVQRIKGHDMICSRIPLHRDGRVWAAVGMVIFRDVEELRLLMRRVDRLQSEVEHYKGELMRQQGARYTLEQITGNSPRMLELKKLVQKVARNDSTVLIRGESGTGKELFAHALHNASPRCARPFVRVNCAALPENLLESELFGYREGAFTGARKGGKPGKFEQANGGSLFLDEIGEMSLNMQAKLLRVLQEKEIERLGDARPVVVDVRLVAASSRNLEEMVRRGAFREDLFYRLNVVVLDIPPLRERSGDIPLLVDDLLQRLSRRLGTIHKSIHPAAMEYLLNYHWPGNVRELENVLERVLNISAGEMITIHDLPVRPLKKAVEELEKTVLRRALKVAGGNRMEAARMLGIGRTTFYEKLARYNIC
ncbi:hypothetical protein A6M21_05625 [Desulfotomaculum copahuensis]|uniref:Sigma-54-dependent Fis family transcriptional regulator n=2 Tax=Desulfotomaculum copahuensis TaxID=1838280 RepID=A0A1B7LHF3_9FIRM|nr:hypothetical protein A6M21_05625 [Desulfotomaculum copahuensis]